MPGFFSCKAERDLFLEGVDALKMWEAAMGDYDMSWIKELRHRNVHQRVGQRKRQQVYRELAPYAIEGGLDSMLEAYYAGVPVEDIVA